MYYRFLGKQKSNEYLIFGVDKVNKQLKLLQTYAINNRTSIKLNDENRYEIINKFDYVHGLMYSFVFQQDQLYDAAAQLIELVTYNYSRYIVKKASNGRNYTDQLRIKRFIFKYYYPIQLNKPYQFVQFRYALQTTLPNTSNPDNDGKRASTIHSIHGNVIYFRQPFNVVNINDTIRKMAVQNYLNLTLLPPLGIQTYDFIDIRQSTLRQNIYRVLLLINKTTMVKYQIDINNQLDPILLSSKVVANISADSFTIDNNTNNNNNNTHTNTNNNNNPTLAQSTKLPTTTTTTTKNIPSYVSSFTQVINVPEQVDVNLSQTDISNGLSNKQITNILANMLGLNTQNIINVKLVKRQLLMNLIDIYTVDYVDNSGEFMEPHRVVFQIPKKPKITISSLSLLGNITAPPPPKPNPQPPKTNSTPPLNPLVLQIASIDQIHKFYQYQPKLNKSIIEPAFPQNKTITPPPIAQPPPNFYGTGLVIPDQLIQNNQNSLPPPLPVSPPPPLTPAPYKFPQLTILTSSQNPQPTIPKTPITIYTTTQKSSSTTSSTSTYTSSSSPNNTSITNNNTSNSTNSSQKYSKQLILQFPNGFQATVYKAKGAIFTPIITTDNSQNNKTNNNNTNQTNTITLSTKLQSISQFLNNKNTRFLPIKFAYTNGYKNFQNLLLKQVQYPSQQVISYIKNIFNNQSYNIRVRSERATKTQPTLSIMLSQIKQKKPIQNLLPKSSDIKIWSTFPQPNIIQLQFVDKGYNIKTTQVDKNFLDKYPSIARIQKLVTPETINNLATVGYVDTYLKNKGQTYSLNQIVSFKNIIYLKQKNMTDGIMNIEQVQLNYQFNQLLLRQTLLYSKKIRGTRAITYHSQKSHIQLAVEAEKKE